MRTKAISVDAWVRLFLVDERKCAKTGVSMDFPCKQTEKSTPTPVFARTPGFATPVVASFWHPPYSLMRAEFSRTRGDLGRPGRFILAIASFVTPGPLSSHGM